MDTVRSLLGVLYGDTRSKLENCLLEISLTVQPIASPEEDQLDLAEERVGSPVAKVNIIAGALEPSLSDCLGILLSNFSIHISMYRLIA